MTLREKAWMILELLEQHRPSGLWPYRRCTCGAHFSDDHLLALLVRILEEK